MQLANTQQPKTLESEKWEDALTLGAVHLQLLTDYLHEFQSELVAIFA
jgi:hypothetical protein